MNTELAFGILPGVVLTTLAMYHISRRLRYRGGPKGILGFQRLRTILLVLVAVSVIGVLITFQWIWLFLSYIWLVYAGITRQDEVLLAFLWQHEHSLYRVIKANPRHYESSDAAKELVRRVEQQLQDAQS